MSTHIPIYILSGRGVKYCIFPAVVALYFAAMASASAFGLSEDDYTYLATQKIERNGAPIHDLSPKELARVHFLINDLRTAQDAIARDKIVNEVLAEFLVHQRWEQSHPGQLWDAPK